MNRKFNINKGTSAWSLLVGTLTIVLLTCYTNLVAMATIVVRCMSTGLIYECPQHTLLRVLNHKKENLRKSSFTCFHSSMTVHFIELYSKCIKPWLVSYPIVIPYYCTVHKSYMVTKRP